MIIFLLLSYQICADAEGVTETKYQVLQNPNSNNIYFTDAGERFNQEELQVAVALGGGGARALVDIGVLKALEEEKIPVDYVVGTSMGAIIAVLYGSGIPIDQIEQLVTEVYFPKMFHLNFPFTKSLLNTTEFNKFLEKIAPVKKLEEFPIPTALLSLDLTYGVNFLGTKGLISQTVQGPYAIPICFSGQPYNELFLIDAGMLEQTPAGAAKVLGADVVISVTAFDELPYNTYASPIRTTIRMINVIKDNLSHEIVDNYSDITIVNNVGDYSYMDFHLAAQFIELGYRETKKLIPQIKELLIKKGITLREPIVRTDLDIDDYLIDIKYNRVVYDQFVWKPLFYYGKDYSIFQDDFLKNNLLKPQWGVEFNKNKFSALLLTKGYNLDNLEVELRLKKLLPKIDLISQIGLNEDSQNYQLELDYYTSNYILAVGFSKFRRKNFLHLHNLYDFNLVNSQFWGETDIFLPIEDQFEQNSVEYKTSHAILHQFNDAMSINTKVVMQDILTQKPLIIYRGVTKSSPTPIQGSIELQYTHHFQYSVELLQSIQLTGVKFNQFIDYQTHDSYALGAGITIDCKVLGLKPSSIGGYLSYDFKAQKPIVKLELDLTF